MKASEVRIGNWVINDAWNGEECTIDYNDIVAMAQWDQNGKEAEFIKPIPLTEEWLKRFGFATKDDDHWCKWIKVPVTGGWIYLGTNITSTVTLFNSNDISLGVHSEHVHQLQNLYFALTGQELTLKP